MALSHEQYVKDVDRIHKGTIQVIGTYSHSHVKIKHKCLTCDRIWMALPSNVRCLGHGCICKHRKSQDWLIIQLKKVHGCKVRLATDLSKRGITGKLSFLCDKGHTFLSATNNVLDGHGCPECYRLTISARCKKTHDTYLAEVREIHGKDIKVLDKYDGATKPLKHKCKRGHVWLTKPNTILSYKAGCPICSPSTYRSYEASMGDRKVLVQGYERYAAEFFNKKGLGNVVFGNRDAIKMPRIQYRDRGENRIYTPDFYRPRAKTLFEVKGIGTLGVFQPELFRTNSKKAKACIKEGYKFVLLLYQANGQLITGYPDDWYLRSRKAFIQFLTEKGCI